MFKKFMQLFYVLVLLLALLPQSLFAAKLYFKASPNNDFVEVRIDPESKRLNVVEGEVLFSGTTSNGLTVQVENGQSILPIWPTPPQYNSDKKSIVFTGGVPNGFDTEGLLFRLSLSSVVPGNIKISYAGNAYLNDGKGTVESITSDFILINVDKGGNDNKKIESFDIMNYKYGIIVLLLIVFGTFIYKYVFKKE